MRFRKLRIAWSVFWGLAAVLLIVLCVRSYWWTDMLLHRKGQTYFAVGTGRGIAYFHGQTWQPFVTVTNKVGWKLVVGPTQSAASASGLKPWVWRPYKEDHDAVSGIYICVPCWCCVAFLGALTAAPWLPWWSWRFSLRTLLIAMTLVALVLGLIVYAMRH
jgi:hypothetical protein